ncbi:WW domain binding protein VOPP1-like [Mytilus trossulus]|uniref:WW domain binding protein VOPP1-like n=1 Tax=Mytilus trossulus TaxID=6551 RepID=UPI003004D9E8
MFPLRDSIISVVIFITNNVVQVVAETCSNGIICNSPYTCCHGNCCHDNDDDYIYGYRMSFWNLWYFWFIILFVLMSCFGGCGYYKQRQRIIRRRTGSPARSNRRSRTIILTNTGETNPTSYAYSGPGAEPYSNVYQPPPYSEVMLHPGLYPTNKENLPPYPGDSSQNRTATDTVPINTDTVPIQPPPYTEIANQNTDLNQPTYQNTTPQAAHQNSAPLQQQTTNQQAPQESNQNVA